MTSLPVLAFLQNTEKYVVSSVLVRTLSTKQDSEIQMGFESRVMKGDKDIQVEVVLLARSISPIDSRYT